MLDNDNNLWCFGWNYYTQCGNIGDINLLPTKNNFFTNINIKKIMCGFRTSIVIDHKNRCYMFGDNTFGQCGCSAQEKTYIPNLIDDNLQIIDVSNTRYHTVLLSLDNKVYSMGNNEFL